MESCQEITLQVPVKFTLPDFYNHAPMEKVAMALRFGAEAVESLSDSIAEGKHSEIAATLEKKFNRKLEQLEREKGLLEQTCEQLHAKISVDSGLVSEMRHKVQEETRAFYKELLAEKDKQIASLREEIKQEVRGLQEKFQSVKESFTRNQGSQEKGKSGEAKAESVIKMAFGSANGFSLQSTGKEAREGDHIMTINTIKALWEIKNYTRMVNKDEVEKLHRDMRSNPDIQIAFMVSLQSGITAHVKSGDIDLEVLEDGRFIVYISNFNKQEEPVFYLQSLRPLLDIVEYLHTQTVHEEAVEIHQLKSKAKIVHKLLLIHRKTLAEVHNNAVQLKKKTDQMITEQLATIKQAEAECINAMKEILTEEDRDSSVADTVLNPQLYTKTSLLDLNAKEKKLYEWLQKNCSEEEGAEVEAKQLVEKMGDLFSEKERNAARSLLQESVWPKGGKKIKGFRLK